MKGKAAITKLGVLVKKELIQQNRTQADFARKIGVRPEYFCMILRGKRSGAKYIEAIQSELSESKSKRKQRGKKIEKGCIDQDETLQI